MKIVMEVGKDKYIGMNAGKVYEVVSRKNAISFDHAFDICNYINGNRKKINAFLRSHSLHMILRVEDMEAPKQDDAFSKVIHTEMTPSGNEIPTEEFAKAC